MNKVPKCLPNNIFAWCSDCFFLRYGLAGSAYLLIAIGLFSCGDEQHKTTENKNVLRDTIKGEFLFSEKKDSLIQNGEYVKYYKNGVIEMRGIMKGGKREGTWKSYYEDGSPWSETEYTDGKKNGKTTSWFGKEKKRYEGFYSNDAESDNWTFWDESGKIVSTKNY